MDAERTLDGLDILVVVEDGASARLVATVLALAGATVKVATSAEEAERLLGSLRPAVIVVDTMLPGMSGLAFVQIVKSVPATREIVYVALTASNGHDSERAAMQAGCAAFVRMPIDTNTFAAIVARHLGRGS